MEYIGLVDCNNFFVSCERLFRPDLRHTPVVVLSSNDGCVVARSNEIKALGIPMGVPYFQVKQDLAAAKAAIFSSNFTLYRDISARVMRALAGEVSATETYSVDEAFFALTAATPEAAAHEALRIKASLEQQIGIPVSVGVARSKTIAKYASEHAKAQAKAGEGNGVAVITGTTWHALQPTTPLQRIWGIGGRMSAQLRTHALHTVADFLSADRLQVSTLFGVGGVRLYDELSEIAVWPLGSRATVTQKSYMSTRSFKARTHDQQAVTDAVLYHVTQVAADLRADGVGCRYLQVSARPSRHGDWALMNGSAELTLDVPTNDTRVLMHYAEELLGGFFDPRVPYMKAGVVVGQVVPLSARQPTLFTDEATAKQTDGIMDLVDGLNAKFGKQTIGVGKQVTEEVWRPRTNLLSPQYTTKWPDLATVKA